MAIIRVFIVDDHQLFIDGLKALLKLVNDIEVVGEASTGQHCLELLKTVEVDVLLTDIRMPEMMGDELVSFVKKLYPDIKILTLSMHYEYYFINRMIEVGSLGYVLKNTGATELEEAIRLVNSGKTYYSPKVQSAIINGFSKEKIKDFKSIGKNDDEIYLTPREIDVLKLVLKGYSSNDIAEILDLSYHTITSHRKNINAKVGTNSLAELSKIALEKGLV